MKTPSRPNPVKKVKRIRRLVGLLALALRVIRRTPGLTVRRVVFFAWRARKVAGVLGKARVLAAPGGLLVVTVVVLRRRRARAADAPPAYATHSVNGNGSLESAIAGPGTRTAGMEAAATTQTERRLQAEKEGSADVDAPNQSAPGGTIPPAPVESALDTPASNGDVNGPNESAPGDAIPPADA